MRILIYASMNLNYLPINKWLNNDDNEYVLFVKHEHKEQYDLIADGIRFNIYSFSDWDDNIEIEQKSIELHNIKPFDRIISIRESDVQRSANVREYLGISGQSSKSASIFRNKYDMKEYLKARGIKVPEVMYITNYIELLKFTEHHGYPIVIKPVNGAGSVNTFVVSSEDELNKISKKISYQNMIVETFVKGDIYHIDGIVLNGELKLITASKYINDCLSYKEGKSTASIFLKSEDIQSRVLIEYGKKIISLMLRPNNFTFHLEVFVDGENITFCEIACRTGGGRITECIEKMFGFNITKELIRYECGYETVINENMDFYRNNKYRGWILSSPLEGRLTYMPDKSPFIEVFDYWKFAKIGSVFKGANSSVFSIAAFSCESEGFDETRESLLAVDKWFKENCIYENKEIELCI